VDLCSFFVIALIFVDLCFHQSWHRKFYVRETDKDVSDDTSSKKNTSQGKSSHRKDLNSSAKITETHEII
jgi:hypothetical protein